VIGFFRRLFNEIRSEINPTPPAEAPEIRPNWLDGQDLFSIHQSRCIRCRLGRSFCDEGSRLLFQRLERERQEDLRKGRRS
jgi:hypothetical protein